MAVGKPCVFRVDYALDAAGGREFGTVFINEKDNLALASVAAGWAKVRSGGGQQSPFVEDLLKAQTAAEAGNLGVHTKDPSSAVTRYASDAGTWCLFVLGFSLVYLREVSDILIVSSFVVGTRFLIGWLVVVHS